MPSGRTSSRRPPRPRAPKQPRPWFDRDAADRACEFFERFLTLDKGFQGQQFKLDEWQSERIIRPLFGTKRDDTGFRWYRRADIWLPKKNTKTTMAAGIALYLMTADGELGAEVYSVANDRDQAAIAWTKASEMVSRNAELREMCNVFRASTTIVVPETLSFYQAVGSDIGDKDGINVHGAICDEIHEWKNPELLTKLVSAQIGRNQPLTVVISTAGDDLTGVGFREYAEDKRILAGKSPIQDRLVVIYEAPPRANWKSRKTWKAANPGYGKTVSIAGLESEFRVALTDPVKEAEFKRYYLNMWVGQVAGTIPMDRWRGACAGPLDVKALEGRDCYVGMDLATRADLTALAAVFKVEDEMRVLPHFFIPEEGLEAKERRDGVPYRQWQKQGFITITPGNVTDWQFVRTYLQGWARRFRILEVGFDPYSAVPISTLLQDDGLTVVEVIQSTKNIAPATREFKNLVIAGKLKHGDNPVLDWNADNARSRVDSNGNERFIKGAKTGRIDGVVATVMALARSTLPGEGPSVYEQRGLLVI